MAESLTVRIVRAHDGAAVQAAAVPATSEHLAQASAWQATLVRRGEPDAAWDWSSFLADARAVEAAGHGRFEIHALTVGTEVQAMMLLETQTRRSRADAGPLVYVEYLAVAPHNRPTAAPRTYKRCGEAMLAIALHRSRELGFQGRIGLHALPTSVAFYTRMAMRDHGEDPEENGLHYFELGPDVLESA